ncbi:hypothetical protein I3760_Q013500 [Carya illinoinensis]|nr:hypothetical protein I3760_Q013500 [Carya illinoinensis]
MAESTLYKKKLEGKVAIVTGGASGIGEATAHVFAKHGARMVVIADVQKEVGQQVAKSIGLNHSAYIHCDVTDEEQVKAMVEWTVKNYGQLDIMFSNAGFLVGRIRPYLTWTYRPLTIYLRSMCAARPHV